MLAAPSTGLYLSAESLGLGSEVRPPDSHSRSPSPPSGNAPSEAGVESVKAEELEGEVERAGAAASSVSRRLLCFASVPHYIPLDASPTSLATRATDCDDHDHAHATQPRSFQFGYPGEDISSI